MLIRQHCSNLIATVIETMSNSSSSSSSSSRSCVTASSNHRHHQIRHGRRRRVLSQRPSWRCSPLHNLMMISLMSMICFFGGSRGTFTSTASILGIVLMGHRSSSASCKMKNYAGLLSSSSRLLPSAVVWMTIIGISTIPEVHAIRTNTKKTTSENEDVSNGNMNRGPPASRNSIDNDNIKNLSLNQILVRAGKRGLGGGLPGALAGVIQVLTLMWLRTTANYQSRYGTTFWQALKILHHEGGIRRLYRGLSFALIQAPLMRFVSTAANDGVEAFVASFEWTRNWGPGRTTILASIIVGCARIALMPIDTMKTVLQVDSAEGFRHLLRRVKAGKLAVLYQGSMVTAVSAITGHYPWFFTYNFLSTADWVTRLISSKLLRNAAIGFVASIVSDTATNALKVIKTTKQALGSKHNSSYLDVVRMIVAADGWKGLFGRALFTRIGTNALQSILFTIVWRGLSEKFSSSNNEKEKEKQ